MMEMMEMMGMTEDFRRRFCVLGEQKTCFCCILMSFFGDWLKRIPALGIFYPLTAEFEIFRGEIRMVFHVKIVKAAIIHSLKLTAKAPENRPSQKETIVFQPSIFRCENVNFREGDY